MKRVLVVDDNDAILKSVSLLLKSRGFDVITNNGNGDLARFVFKHKPDVILLDYLLSGKNGADVVRQFKKNEATAHIPIIAVSAHPSAHLQMAQEGVYAFIQKPFDSGTIISKIEQILKLQPPTPEEAQNKM
jgi:CheY-like chemotaxis protein